MQADAKTQIRKIRFGVCAVVFLAWVACLGWMTLTSSKPPTDRSLTEVETSAQPQ